MPMPPPVSTSHRSTAIPRKRPVVPVFTPAGVTLQLLPHSQGSTATIHNLKQERDRTKWKVLPPGRT